MECRCGATPRHATRTRDVQQIAMTEMPIRAIQKVNKVASRPRLAPRDSLSVPTAPRARAVRPRTSQTQSPRRYGIKRKTERTALRHHHHPRQAQDPPPPPPPPRAVRGQPALGR